MAEPLGGDAKGDKARLPSTSSLGPQEIPKADLVALSNETFAKTAAYLSGELESKQNTWLIVSINLSWDCSCHLGTADEYGLLERMNNATAQRYIDMKQISQNIKKSMADLNDKCTDTNKVWLYFLICFSSQICIFNPI